MRPRERQLAAIRHELTDRLSIDAICVENAQEIAAYLDIPVDAVLDRLGIDGRIVAAGYRGMLPPETNGMIWNEWGTVSTGDYSTMRHHPLAAASSVAEVARASWPDPRQYDFTAAAGVARSLAETYAVRGPYWQPLFCRVCDLFGMEEAMVRMLTETEIFEAALEAVFQYTATYCEYLLDACGDAMPILCLGDDFATQRGLMIDPEQWRALLKPRYARLFEIGKQRGKFVWFHSCGDITAVLPDLIDIGMDVWETVQLHTLPCSPQQLKREYGAHLTFFGAVSTQRLPFVSPAEIQDEVMVCIETLGKGGGYICGPDHHIKPDVPPENAVALFDAAQRYRGEGYTRARCPATA